MKKILLITLIFLAFGVSKASADIVLFEWAFNINGENIYDSLNGDNIGDVPNLTASGFDDSATGLGTLTWISSTSSGYFISFFDHEIDETIDTFSNEYGSAVGTRLTGQSWEIDEPGWDSDAVIGYDVNGDPIYYTGDIYTNTVFGGLDNDSFFNSIDGYLSVYESPISDDVSMAMGWTFDLDDGYLAVITMNLTDTAPTSGFYLAQTDPYSGNAVYLSSTLEIIGGTEPVPEPATMLLLGTGLAGLFGFGRKRFKK
ncbi:conserved exported hypothetical protein [uncultured Desulfobacterium sp.]|uniref:Ice-binding protein C-terminal domain-containing protein n=1 Tax=uncultured Desulfobacterium sp. TaxID=201089 RepID=A0A445MTY9_9BACT|nr:conserved exported hypothetical protein [uncultured Desulfobacterium sp.]